MKIERIEVKNYRTLENVKVNFDGYYSAISGQNNAGKTALIRVLSNTFKDNSREIFYFRDDDDQISYREDRTQWVSGDPDISISYFVNVSRSLDPGLFGFIEKFSEKEIQADETSIKLNILATKDKQEKYTAVVEGEPLESFESTEIFKKIKSSNLAFIHDSSDSRSAFFASRRHTVHELMFSPEEKEEIAKEQSKIQKKIKNISKTHKAELSELLGHLEDAYEVEFTIPEGMLSRSVPFRINLKDKNVDIPLDDWGSGTKNRTQIMMSILQANRIKAEVDENRITPMVIIEEPESFLHPSAQAEFGRVLRNLANELKIQTIVTTHSPYMLCQENVKSNILLNRKIYRGKLKETVVVDVDTDNWMQPFSDILGLNNIEFEPWKQALSANKEAIVLVEGDIDKKYIDHLRSLGLSGFDLPEDVEIIPYDGKDALKNTVLLKFMVQKFNKVYFTFDLDAKNELTRPMTQLDLTEKTDYMAIGLDDPGKDCMEGLLPDSIHSSVYSNNPDLVMKMSSRDGKARKSAKNGLKAKMLEEFLSKQDLTVEDVKLFKPLFQNIRKWCSS